MRFGWEKIAVFLLLGGLLHTLTAGPEMKKDPLREKAAAGDAESAFYVKDCRYIIREVITKHYNTTLGQKDESVKRYSSWVETATDQHLSLFLEIAQKVGYSFCFGYKGMLQDIQLFGFPPPYNNTKISRKREQTT